MNNHDTDNDDDKPEHWYPTNLSEWIWVGKKRAEAIAAINEIRDAADTEHQRITDWVTNATTKPSRTIEWANQLLTNEALQRRETNPDNKTFNLPHVKIKTQAHKPKPRIYNETSFITWAQEHLPDAVKTTHKALISKLGPVTASPLGTVITPDGEEVPGTEMTEESVTVTFEDIEGL